MTACNSLLYYYIFYCDDVRGVFLFWVVRYIAITVGLRLYGGCGKKMSATFFLCTVFSL